MCRQELELELLRRSECEMLAMLDEMAGEMSYSSWSSSSSSSPSDSSCDESEPESGPTPRGGVKRAVSWASDSDGAAPQCKRQRSRSEMPDCCEVLEHVAATLDKSGRTARRWDACALQWNAAFGRAEGHAMKGDNFKMHVKRLLAERKQRSHVTLWSVLWNAPSREELGEVLRARLEPLGPTWPVAAMADFIWAVKSDRASVRANYCNIDRWDAAVHAQIVEAAVRLHREGVPVVRHLAAVFPAFNVEMMILSACRCDACALFGACAHQDSAHDLLLEFTKRKSAFIAHALRCIDAAGGADSPDARHCAFLDMRYSHWASFVATISFADFCTIIRPAISGAATNLV
jgi:hypothetical protein